MWTGPVDARTLISHGNRTCFAGERSPVILALSVSQNEMSGRSTWSLVGRTCVDSAVVSFATISKSTDKRPGLAALVVAPKSDALLAAVARELRRLTRHVEDLHFLDLPGRLASQILRLADEERRYRLAVSLHAASDELRSKLMDKEKPINLMVGAAAKK